MILVRIDIFTILPFLLLAEDDGNRHELAIFSEKLFYLGLAGVFRCVVRQVHGDGRHLLRNHEGRIEAKSEMTYNTGNLILILGKELPCRREGYLVDVLVDLLLCHSDSPVRQLENLLFFIEFNPYAHVGEFSLDVSC